MWVGHRSDVTGCYVLRNIDLKHGSQRNRMLIVYSESYRKPGAAVPRSSRSFIL